MNKKTDLRIEILSIDQLQEYENNAREHGEIDIAAIKDSIEAFGFNDPIGIWSEDNVIVEGHGRLAAARALGMTEVPCIRLDHMTDEERRAYALAHNKTAELSGWDFQKLDAELLRIKEIDMEALGFEIPTFDNETHKDNFLAEEEDVEIICKAGDLWVLGSHRLMCGDSTKKEDVEKLMGGYSLT